MIKAISNIPEKLKICGGNLYRNEMIREDFSVMEVNNTPTCGISLKYYEGLHIMKAMDPRGFQVSISNFSDLMKEVTIERGVIQEDIVYARPDSRSDSWILLTPAMIKGARRRIGSVKELKPGMVYNFGMDDLNEVYLGRLKWRNNSYDGVGEFYSHHTFANPEKGTIGWRYNPKDAIETGIDDPDTYSLALETFKESYLGNPEIKIEKILLRDQKYVEFKPEMIFPEGYKDHEFYYSPHVVFLEQKSPSEIMVLAVSGYYRMARDWGYIAEQQHNISWNKITITIDPLGKPKWNFQSNRAGGSSDYVGEIMQKLLKDSGWKCIGIIKGTDIDSYTGRNNHFINCILSNGEEMLMSDAAKIHTLNFRYNGNKRH